MKCVKCGTEWTDNNNTVNLKKCPFCGNLLSGNAGVTDYSTMADVLKYIVCKYGENVFNDNYKVVNIFRDLAPKLEKESKIFEVAMNSHVERYFLNKNGTHECNIIQFKSDMEYLMSPEAIVMVINAFSQALGIENINSNLQFSTTPEMYFNNGLHSDNVDINSKFLNLNVKDTFKFGMKNGSHIEWIILKKEKKRIFVIAKYLIGVRRYDRCSNEWEHSELREWLNGEFYNNSFDTCEKVFISGEITLLTKEEVEGLMTKEERAGNNQWWLRSSIPLNSHCLWCVSADGSLSFEYFDNYSSSVRPAFWINLRY